MTDYETTSPEVGFLKENTIMRFPIRITETTALRVAASRTEILAFCENDTVREKKNLFYVSDALIGSFTFS